ncbi:MAG: type II secretion system protein [Patescibacteria group bacterium]
MTKGFTPLEVFKKKFLLKIFSRPLIKNNIKTTSCLRRQECHTPRPLTGFTLLELLIVISILAILSTVVVLVLNPAEYLKQARDSQRVSDLATLNSAIALYLSTATTISMGTCTAGYYYCSIATAGNLPGGTTACTSNTTSTSVTSGTGWIPIIFSGIPGGSPISREPVDPTNSETYKYAYACNSSNQYELDAKLESIKYTSTNNLGVNDGGNNSSAYEVGTDLTLIPST